MKKFLIAMIGAATLIGSVPLVPEPAAANHRYGHVCRIVVVKKVVWRYHRRYVVRERVRRCYWIH